jgi:hypothetical protein
MSTSRSAASAGSSPAMMSSDVQTAKAETNSANSGTIQPRAVPSADIVRIPYPTGRP